MEFTIKLIIPDFLATFFRALCRKKIMITALLIPFALTVSAYTGTKTNDVIDALVDPPHKFAFGDTVDAKRMNENFQMLNERIKNLYEKKTQDLVKRIDDIDAKVFSTNSGIEKKFKDRIDVLKAGAVPENIVVIWFGPYEEIPFHNGWVLCDGQNGTPDLRGKFIVGADRDTVESTIPLDGSPYSFYMGEINDNPVHAHSMPHSHTADVERNGSHIHAWLWPDSYWKTNNSLRYEVSLFADYNGQYNSSGSGFIPLNRNTYANWPYYTNESGLHKHDIELTGDNDMSMVTDSAKTMPPYYGLFYIMKKNNK